jgi:hypothetical protein
MFGTAVSPWFQLFAFIVCAALFAFALTTFVRGGKKFTTPALWSGVGALIFLSAGVFLFYFGETAGEADARLLQTEGMTELNEKAPQIPSAVEIQKDVQAKEKKTFEATSKSVTDHTNEADEALDRAVKRAQERDEDPFHD